MLVAVALTLAPTAASSDVTAGQRVFVNLTSVTIGTSSCCSILASILKPDGSTMSGTTKYVGTSGGYLDTVTLPTSGTYTILLDPQGTATGSATVTAYDVPADPAPTLQPSQAGTAGMLTTTVPGQNISPTSGTYKIFVDPQGTATGSAT